MNGISNVKSRYIFYVVNTAALELQFARKILCSQIQCNLSAAKVNFERGLIKCVCLCVCVCVCVRVRVHVCILCMFCVLCV